jgi:hypothetical protein
LETKTARVAELEAALAEVEPLRRRIAELEAEKGAAAIKDDVVNVEETSNTTKIAIGVGGAIVGAGIALAAKFLWALVHAAK